MRSTQLATPSAATKSKATSAASVSAATSITDRQAPRWRRRKESRSAELIDAALLLFAQSGYAQTRLDDVAARAGISKGTVYLYFSSKQDLFEAVVQERASPWIDALQARPIDDSQPTDIVIREVLFWGWNQFLESKLYLIARIVLAESNNFPHLAQAYLREVMGPVHQYLISLLERGIARGEIDGQASRERVKALLAPLSWLALWRHALVNNGNQPPLREDVYVNEAIEMAVRSLTPRP
jgi:AcrR family transcriptional regulator